MVVLQAQSTGLPPGATSPRDAAIVNMNTNAKLLTELNKTSGGRRAKRGGQVTQMTQVPTVPGTNSLYDPAAGTSQSVSAQQYNITKLTMDNDAQSALDSKAVLVPVPKGGRRKRSSSRKSRGGVTWGCLSGGRQSRKRNGRSGRSGRSGRRKSGTKKHRKG